MGLPVGVRAAAAHRRAGIARSVPTRPPVPPGVCRQASPAPWRVLVPTSRGSNHVPPRVGHQPQPTEGLHKTGGARGEHDIAGQSNVGTGACSDPVHGGDHRALHGGECDESTDCSSAPGIRPDPAARRSGVATLSCKSWPAQKPRPRPVSSRQRTSVMGFNCRERVTQLGVHFAREAVQSVGPVQRNFSHAQHEMCNSIVAYAITGVMSGA